MTMNYGVIGAIICLFFASHIVRELGISSPWSYVLMGGGALFGMLAWWFSPIPDSNGGMAPVPQNKGWGWSSDDD